MRTRRARLLAGFVAGACALAACGGCGSRDASTTLRFWAMGREGEVVQDLVHDFERTHPDIHVQVQQIPWSAAHEKLLTAYVGGSMPDVAQLGNTWIPEFAALGSIEPLDARIAASRAVARARYFPGIWDTNVLDGVTYGVPWYVDTRLLFYRRDLLERAGWRAMPGSWAEWERCMEDVRRAGAHTAIFLPTNEYTPWILFGMQTGSRMLKDDDTRGDFEGPRYHRAVSFFMDLFHRRLAPTIEGASIANVYQEFERGTFAMYITGPWQLGEFRNRLSPAMQSSWATAPLPGPDGPASGVSTAGGSSLVLFHGTRHADAAWQLLEYLSAPEQQVRFFRLTGDLPARVEAWGDSALAGDPNAAAFRVQLERAVPTPKIPEWEQISIRLQDAVASMVLGHVPPDTALRALDRDVDRMLEKRRWLVERARRRATTTPATAVVR